MLALLFFTLHAASYTLTKLPPTNSPPPAMISSSAVYEKETNTLYSIGGDQIQNSKQIPTIFSFDLTNKLWNIVNSLSEYSPQYTLLNGAYLRNDRKIINFGLWSEVLIFNLAVKEWTKTETYGDRTGSLTSFGYTSFSHNGTDFVGIYGGVNENSYSGELYLLNVYTLETIKMPNVGKGPFGSQYPSIEYYNGSIYIFGYSHIAKTLGLKKGNELYRYDLDGGYWEEVEVNGIIPENRVGHFSAIYKDEMYIAYGFIQEPPNEYYNCYKFNFETRTWFYLTEFNSTYRAVASKVQVDNIIYLMFGRDAKNVYNTILAIDLEPEIPVLSVVSGQWVSPPDRVNHCSFVVNQKMYIFGGSNAGKYESEVLYNDMWAFDFETEQWMTIKALGEIPSPRKQFGCSKTTGNVAAIFGGVDETGYLNELYYFHEPQLYWYKVTSSNSPPSIRSLSCLAFYNNLLYVIGGKNDKTTFDEIWIYDFATNKYSISSSTITAAGFYSISDAKCWIDTYTDKVKLMVIGGNDFNLLPNTYIFEYELLQNNEFNLTTNLFGSIQNLTLFGSENSVIVTEDFIIRIGCTLYSYVMVLEFIVYDRKTLKPNILQITDISKKFVSWGHSAIHYKNSIYIFGGGGAAIIYKSIKLNNFFLKLDLSPEFNIGCSRATEGGGCKPCPKGTYFDKKKCEKCPTGRYNDLLGADSLEQCSPCSESTFNNKQGASYCLQCSYTEICPIGTTNPFKISESPSNSSVQPTIYESKKIYVSNIINNMWYVFGGVVLIIFIVSFLLDRIYITIKTFDFFVDRHEFKLEEPIKYKKTSLGGVFSLMFLIACGITLVSGFLNFYYNNLTELRALVPVITLDKVIVSKFVSLNVTFFIYGGNCVLDDKCNPLIEYIDEGFSYNKRKVTCKQVKSNCQVYVEYENLKLTSKNSGIYIKMKEKFSYSSGLSVNITSSSSIPNQISSIMTSIQPFSTKTLFRGKTPSVFYYKFTPSIFSSESSEWPAEDTGFHISTDQVAESGSVAPRETLNLQLYMLVNILIVESDTAMQAQRIQNQTWFEFGGSLLGSLFGLLGIFGLVLSITENLTDSVETKIRKKKFFKESSFRNMKLKAEFGEYHYSHIQTKDKHFESRITAT